MFFRSEDAVTTWCADKNEPRGEVLSIALLWQLAQLWYHNRLSVEYHGRTLLDVQAIFQQLGLTSAFWQSNADLNAPQK
ncbi:MAG: hypothetical protein KA765_16585 [Thermoflexales bacterium]|nr:hypothetical protein [Thermoflexales bacterium]